MTAIATIIIIIEYGDLSLDSKIGKFLQPSRLASFPLAPPLKTNQLNPLPSPAEKWENVGDAILRS
jgi:hypothetical protein